MQSIVEVVCLGGAKTYNSIYTDPGYCKMVIVQDDEKFPSPRLCLLRKWPNFDGFGFHLFEDLLNSTGSLKIENVVKGSPAEAGGLRPNDVIIEINGDNIEYKSFFRLIEILKDAFSQQEMELLVLTELDAEWYRQRNICVNSNFPNIEYCETPYYGHKFKPLDSLSQVISNQSGSGTLKITNPQIEFHSNTGKLYRTTLVIDNNNAKYTRIEELPKGTVNETTSESTPLNVYYRKGFTGVPSEMVADSGHGSMSARRSTPVSAYSTTMSPYSTIGKACGEQASVDLLHDKWAELMDKYLDNKYRSSSTGPSPAIHEEYQPTQNEQQQHQHQADGTGSTKRNHVIVLNDTNYETSKRSRSQNPNDSSTGSFSFLFSGRDDCYASQSPLTGYNQQRQQSPHHRQSHPHVRYQSPHHGVSSPTRNKANKAEKPYYYSKSDSEKTTFDSYQMQKIYQQETRESSPYRAPHSIILRPKVISKSLGFTLDENEIIKSGTYYVKHVEPGSASATAGLKTGDKITKINGKSTNGMSYDDFCSEIAIAQQQHERHNMIHLMVMRRSSKLSQINEQQQTSGSTVLPIQNNFSSNIATNEQQQKFAENNINNTIPSNLVSVVKVTSPLFNDDVNKDSNKYPIYAGSTTPSVVRQPNVIYKHEVNEEINYQEYIQTTKRRTENTYERDIPISKVTPEKPKEPENIPPIPTTSPPKSPATSRDRLSPTKLPPSTTTSQAGKSALGILTKLSIAAENETDDDTSKSSSKDISKVSETDSKKGEQLVTKTLISTIENKQSKEQVEFYENIESSVSESKQTPREPSSESTHSIACETKNFNELAEQKIEKFEPVIIEPEPVAEEKLDIEKLKTKLKLYHIEVIPEFFGFGVILNADKDKEDENELVYPSIDIQPDSPASLAGLEKGQRLIAVDGKYINKDIKTLNDLADAIDNSYYQLGYTDFLVIDPDVWEVLKKDKKLMNSLGAEPEPVIVPSTSKPDIPGSSDKLNEKIIPRFCRLVRESPEDQYGFDFKTLKTEGKHIATNVRDGYPAQKAGLRNGDYIIEVNGKSIESMEHDAVVNLIFSNIKQVDLLVVEDLKGYKKSRKQIENVQTDQSNITSEGDQTPIKGVVTQHPIHLIPTYQGIGLHLNYEGVINFIEPNSPAEAAGLRKNQRIVEVNGQNVRGKSNRDIAKIIKANINNLTIGVESPSEGSTKNDDSFESRPDTSVIGNLVIPPSQITRAVDENIFMQSKATSEAALNQKETNLQSSVSSKTGKTVSDDLTNVRVCNLVERPDFVGFGFSLRKNEVGPHQIANVEVDSPAKFSGLRNDDYLLKVNDNYVVGERYSKTVTRIKNESGKGRIKLEVIEPQLCPKDLKETKINVPSGYVSVSSTGNLSPIVSSTKDKRRKDGEFDTSAPPFSGSVRSVPEYMNVSPDSSKRPTSVPPALNEPFVQQRPVSMNDLDTIDPKLSVRSTGAKSFTSTTTFSAEAINDLKISGNITSGSVRSVPNVAYSAKNPPKFKRCTILSSPEFKGFGFTINSQMKPKYMIFDVDPNSPAELAGLRKTDVLIEIDNKNIRRSSFEKVRSLLSRALNNGKVELLVISKEGYLWFKEKKKRFSSKLTNENNVELFSNTQVSSSPNEVTRSRLSLSGSQPNIARSISPIFDTTKPNTEKIYCTLKRREDFQGFGMSVSTTTAKQKNDPRNFVPVVTNVERGSPAEIAGLRLGDQIIEINGKSTVKQNNDFIAKSIRNSGNEVHVVVCRDVPRTDSESTSRKATVELNDSNLETSKLSEQRESSERVSLKNEKRSRSASPTIIKSSMTMSSSKIQIDSPNSIRPRNSSEPPSPVTKDAPAPRLCRIRNNESSLGFVVAGSKNSRGVFKVTDITPNSPAYTSGLRNDDYIIEIGGINVEKMTYDEIVNLIKQKKEEDDLQMLVADKSTIEWYKERDTSISSRLVPKLTYIETLLQEEMQYNISDSTNTTHRISQESLNALEDEENS